MKFSLLRIVKVRAFEGIPSNSRIESKRFLHQSFERLQKYVNSQWINPFEKDKYNVLLRTRMASRAQSHVTDTDTHGQQLPIGIWHLAIRIQVLQGLILHKPNKLTSDPWPFFLRFCVRPDIPIPQTSTVPLREWGMWCVCVCGGNSAAPVEGEFRWKNHPWHLCSTSIFCPFKMSIKESPNVLIRYLCFCAEISGTQRHTSPLIRSMFFAGLFVTRPFEPLGTVWGRHLMGNFIVSEKLYPHFLCIIPTRRSGLKGRPDPWKSLRDPKKSLGFVSDPFFRKICPNWKRPFSKLEDLASKAPKIIWEKQNLTSEGTAEILRWKGWQTERDCFKLRLKPNRSR